MKFIQIKVKKGSRFTDWQRPKMKGYLMACCDCGLVHELDFRVAVVDKVYKNGQRVGRIIATKEDDQFFLEFKIARHEGYTKKQRSKNNYDKK